MKDEISMDLTMQWIASETVTKVFKAIQAYPDVPATKHKCSIEEYFGTYGAPLLRAMGGFDLLTKLSVKELFGLYPYFFNAALHLVESTCNEPISEDIKKEITALKYEKAG